MAIKKEITLRAVFWRFLIELLLGLVLAIIVPFIIFIIVTSCGLTKDSNSNERIAQNIASKLIKTDNINSVMSHIPKKINYVEMDKSYNIISSSMNKQEIKDAISFVRDGTNLLDSENRYLLVNREDEYVILLYHIGSVYYNQWMQRYLPSIEKIFIMVVIINCITYCILLVKYFAEKFRKQLQPILYATREVSTENLDFKIGYSSIKEFQDILISFSEMKMELSESLKKQWKSEQMQKEQIALLAHDLKTPLTVIQGNIDLLEETKLSAEQKEYIQYASESSVQMTQNIGIIIELSKAAMGYEYHFEEFDFPTLWNDIVCKTKTLCYRKHIDLQNNIGVICRYLKGDQMLIERAIMNIISNAVEHTPENGEILINANLEKHMLKIQVIDSGKGFSKESLKHAKQRFYMDKQNRNGSMHFGMGLYFASLVIEKHKGKLILTNNNKDKGAKVVIILPIK